VDACGLPSARLPQLACAPVRLAPARRADALSMMLFDTVHHRGQISVYLRAVGGKVPSIYGPSGDEMWEMPTAAGA